MPAFTYPKSHRLRSKQDFEAVYQKSFRVVGSFFLLRVRPYKKHSRLGLLISKKFGGAPYRNRVKRVLRDMFRLSHPALPLDVHFSQIRPFTQKNKAKKELKKMFKVLRDKPYLQAHAHEREAYLKDIRFSAPMSPAAWLVFQALLLYKRWLSPALQPACRFTPTCSIYALDAVRMHGFIQGIRLAVWRIMRCQPLGKGGYDPVPALLNKPEAVKPNIKKYKKKK